MRESDYVLQPGDSQFIEDLARVVKQGGVWACPASVSCFRIEHDKKRMVLIDGDPEHEVNRRTVKAAAAVGWTVLTVEEAKDA